MKIRPKILLAFWVPSVVMLIVGAVNLRALNRSRTTTNALRHTEQVIVSTDGLLQAPSAGETGERGFIITRLDSFLTPFTQGNATFQAAATQLKALLSDPALVTRVDQMIQLHQQWLDDAATPSIAAARAGTLDAATKLVSSGTGKGLTDQLRVIAADIVRTEQKLLQTGTATSDSASRSARAVLLGGLVLIL